MALQDSFVFPDVCLITLICPLFVVAVSPDLFPIGGIRCWWQAVLFGSTLASTWTCSVRRLSCQQGNQHTVKLDCYFSVDSLYLCLSSYGMAFFCVVAFGLLFILHVDSTWWQSTLHTFSKFRLLLFDLKKLQSLFIDHLFQSSHMDSFLSSLSVIS